METLWSWWKVSVCAWGGGGGCLSFVGWLIHSLSLSLPYSPLLVRTEPYSQREVRAHIQRLKDLLCTNPLQQAMSCSDGLTLSFLASITITDPEGKLLISVSGMYMHVHVL